MLAVITDQKVVPKGSCLPGLSQGLTAGSAAYASASRTAKCDPRSVMRPGQEGVCGVEVQLGNSGVQSDGEALYSLVEYLARLLGRRRGGHHSMTQHSEL